MLFAAHYVLYAWYCVLRTVYYGQVSECYTLCGVAYMLSGLLYMPCALCHLPLYGTCYMIYAICCTLYVTRYIPLAVYYIYSICLHLLYTAQDSLMYPPSIESQRRWHETLSSSEVLNGHSKPQEIPNAKKSQTSDLKKIESAFNTGSVEPQRSPISIEDPVWNSAASAGHLPGSRLRLAGLGFWG